MNLYGCDSLVALPILNYHNAIAHSMTQEKCFFLNAILFQFAINKIKTKCCRYNNKYHKWKKVKRMSKFLA